MDILIVQIDVDHILFRLTNNSLYDDFLKMLSQKFEMRLMGALTYFLGFRVKEN